MAVQRILPDEDRLRRVVGVVLLVPGLALLGWLGWTIATFPDGIRSYIGAGFLLFLGAAPTIIGGRLVLFPKVVLEIDVESRRYAVIRRGAQNQAGPLDALGPLTVRERTRRLSKGGHITEYAVVPSQHSAIDLYCGKSAGKARRKMETFAKAWGLSAQSLGGAVRKPDELDLPLHERLRSDEDVIKRSELPPGSTVRIEVLPMGYALVSTGRDSTSMWVGIIFLGIGLYPILSASPGARLIHFADLDDAEKIGTLLLAGFAAVMAAFAARCFRDAFRPGSVRITLDGVRYRRRRMRFAEIEEVTLNPIEIVGDRRSIRLADSFCPPKEARAVAHELRRIIIEVGSQTS